MIENPHLIYDIGLHRGEDTDYYLNKGFDVVGFEANPELIAHCKIRFRDAIACGRLRIIEGAIAPQSAGGKVTFYRNPKMSVWGTVDPRWAQRNACRGFESESVYIPRVDIEDVYRSLGIPFYLKIDIEGVDTLVLEALRRFEGRPRYVSIESTMTNFDELRAEMALLSDLGYTKFKPVEQSTVPGTACSTKTLDGRELEHIFEQHASGPFGEDIPQPWLSFEETLQAYQSIFFIYRHFGDNSLVAKMPNSVQRVLRKLYRIWTGHRPLSGCWYDTHASL